MKPTSLQMRGWAAQWTYRWVTLYFQMHYMHFFNILRPEKWPTLFKRHFQKHFRQCFDFMYAFKVLQWNSLGATGCIIWQRHLLWRRQKYRTARKHAPHRRGRINFWLSILARTGGVVELMLGSVFIIELDTGLAGIYFHRYCTEYDVCHKQNT